MNTETSVNLQNVREQLQEDIITIVDHFYDVMGGKKPTVHNFDRLKDVLCQAVVDNINKLK